MPQLALDILEVESGNDLLDAIVRRGGAVLRTYSAGVPIAVPRLHLIEGRLAHVDGRYGAARRAYDRATRAAERLGMPWEAQEATRHRRAMTQR